MPIVLHVVAAIVVVLVVTRAAGALAIRLGQPPVVGELVGGILLGPSLAGWLAPDLSARLFAPEVMSYLAWHARIGVIVFMFLVGLETDLRVVWRSGRATLLISHASIVVPFAMGLALATVIYRRLAPPGVPFTPFALFIGVSLSVTAFPVLARILRDRGLARTPLGTIALACAAVDDVTAWGLLAIVISIAQSGGWEAAVTALPAVVVEQLGHYAIFVAFVAGAVLPGHAWARTPLRRWLEPLVSTLMLPVFFAFSGLRTEIGLIEGAGNWGLCALIVGVACIGKFGGGAGAARIAGFDWREAAALGVLMNTRGLVELVVLNLGLDLGIISPVLFTMLVVMALVTTWMTSPLLKAMRLPP